MFQLVAVREDMWEDSPEESSEGAVETGDEHDGKNNSASNSDRPDGMLKKKKKNLYFFTSHFFFVTAAKVQWFSLLASIVTYINPFILPLPHSLHSFFS